MEAQVGILGTECPGHEAFPQRVCLFHVECLVVCVCVLITTTQGRKREGDTGEMERRGRERDTEGDTEEVREGEQRERERHTQGDTQGDIHIHNMLHTN